MLISLFSPARVRVGIVSSLSKLKACYAVDLIHRQMRVFPSVHPNGLKHRIHVVAPGEVQSGRIYGRSIQEDRCALGCMAAKSAKQRFRYILIIGKERPDLIAGMAKP